MPYGKALGPTCLQRLQQGLRIRDSAAMVPTNRQVLLLLCRQSFTCLSPGFCGLQGIEQYFSPLLGGGWISRNG